MNFGRTVARDTGAPLCPLSSSQPPVERVYRGLAVECAPVLSRDYDLNERVLLKMERLLHRPLTAEERRLLLLASEAVDVCPPDSLPDETAA